jgi:hypothetical protein
MRIGLLILFSSLFFSTKILAQGCVAIKGSTSGCSRPSDEKGWELNLNNRYFRSYKHYVGTNEQKERVEKKTNVINNVYELDITVTRNLNSRMSVAATLPIMAFNRTSLYEHYQTERYKTRSFGIGDARISVYRWMLKPAKNYKGNFQLGFGIKLPTGNYNYQDYFYKKADSSVLAPVDQSIQPGDGGTGISFEMNGYYNFKPKIGVYANIFYLCNPREVNGTSTARGGTPSATAKKYNTDVMSVPDQFMARAGAGYTVKKFTFSGGIRIEGLPSGDLIGGDRGFRRPGYIISAEPSVTYQSLSKKTSIILAVPVALKRNRTQSDSDKRRTADTGIHQQGDAAFADYLINVGVIFKL